MANQYTPKNINPSTIGLQYFYSTRLGPGDGIFNYNFPFGPNDLINPANSPVGFLACTYSELHYFKYFISPGAAGTVDNIVVTVFSQQTMTAPFVTTVLDGPSSLAPGILGTYTSSPIINVSAGGILAINVDADYSNLTLDSDIYNGTFIC